MKLFSYKGYDAQGARAKGWIEAADLKEARERLLRQGVYPRQVSEAGSGRSAGHQSRLTVGVRLRVYRELSALIEAGTPLERAVTLLMGSSDFSQRAGALTTIREAVRGGEPVRHALKEISRDWQSYEDAILEVGEETGTLALSFQTLADFLEEQMEWEEETKTALLYPLVIFFFAVIVIGISSLWLLPSMQVRLEEAGLSLPAWSQWLTAAGGGLFYAVCGLSVAWLLLRSRLHHWTGGSTHPAGRLEQMAGRIPPVRSLLEALFVYRFSRTLTTLLRGGIVLDRGFPLAVRSSGSRLLQQVSESLTDGLQRGEPLSEVTARAPWLRAVLPGWIRAGEESGDLSPMLDQAAQQTRRRLNRMRERSLKLLEPVMILFIGMFVLALSFAMLGPILSMNDMLSP